MTKHQSGIAVLALLHCLHAQPQIDPAWYYAPIWNARQGHTLTFDPVRRSTVLFGGQGNWEGTPGYRAETIEWDGSAWVTLQPNAVPPMRTNHAAAYDPITRTVVVFGGDQDFRPLSDTWLWDGHEWRKASPRRVPRARYLHSMGTDWVHGCVVLFGGTDGTSEFFDTWLWSGTDWVPVPPGNTPPASVECRDLAFDVRNGGVLLYGGYSQGSGFSDQTWCFDGRTWRHIQTTTAGPGPLSYHAMATVPSTGDIFLFGGGNSSSWFPSDKTWRWNGSSWSEVVTLVRPERRGGPAMAHDGNQLVLFGGGFPQVGERRTWGLAGSTWTLLDDPEVGVVTGCVYEAARDQVLVFQPGRMRPYRDRSLGSPSPTPFGTNWPVLGHHAAAGITMAWTGSSPTVWFWDGRSWTADAQPSPNSLTCYYDHRQLKLVAVDAGQREFHAWDPSGWTVTNWQGGPDLQRYTSYPVWGYDAGRGRTVVYVPKRIDAGETWEWDGSTWQLAQPLSTNSPGAARSAAMTYSPSLGGLVYAGVYGFNWTPPTSSLLLWDGTAWHPVTTGGVLSHADSVRLTYDTQRNRLFAMYGPDPVSNLRVADIFPLRESNRYPRLGEYVAFDPVLPSEAGLPMAVALSHDSHPGIPVRLNTAGTFDLFPLAASPLLAATLQVDTLDPIGHGHFAYTMPAHAALLDRSVHAAGFTVRGASIGLISNNAKLWFRR